MAHDFVQIPPDSTGKKIRHTKRLDIEITNIQIDLNSIESGQVLVGNSSGATGVYVGNSTDVSSTFLYLTNTIGTFAAGELIKLSGTTVATMYSADVQYTNNIHISDANSPANKLSIDHEGSAFVRYSEGDLGFDAFGHAQFSQINHIDNHMFTYGDTPSKYFDDIQSGGAITGSASDSSLLLSVNSTSGSRITRTTHQNYPYNPGEGNEFIISLRSGDSGKAGVVRRWGLFDDNDGMFFELNGADLKVGIRNSSSGTVVENLVSGSMLNGDSLDDVITSSFVLDVSKYNLFWIDYQWLGVGKVRMGSFAPDGKRITIHTFKNPNKYTVPYMKRGTLPFRIEMFNETATASSSELRMICATIARQSSDVTYPGEYITYNTTETAISSSEFVPLLSARPQDTFNGIMNRTTLIPTGFTLYVDGDPIRLDVIANANLTGSTFTAPINPISSTDIDIDATALSGGSRVNTLMFPSGVHERVLLENLENTLNLSADGVTTPIFTIAAKVMKTGGSATVTMLVRWKESR